VEYGPQTLWPTTASKDAGRPVPSRLDLPRVELIIRKGYRATIDSYSAFRENDRKTPTGLAGYLRERGVERVTLCGLATDFCVFFSAIDARRPVCDHVALDASRAIDIDGSLAQALAAMREAGVCCSTRGFGSVYTRRGSGRRSTWNVGVPRRIGRRTISKSVRRGRSISGNPRAPAGSGPTGSGGVAWAGWLCAEWFCAGWLLRGVTASGIGAAASGAAALPRATPRSAGRCAAPGGAAGCRAAPFWRAPSP